MSFTIHTFPRHHLPSSTHAVAKRCLSALQDAQTFQEGRDALLRHYYPEVRHSFASPSTSLVLPDPVETWQKHVGSKGRYVVEPEVLTKVVRDARNDTTSTPYERVGRVLEWLKHCKQEHPEMEWGHAALRRWMRSLLLDFTLRDALHAPGPLLPEPHEVLMRSVEMWRVQGASVPWWDVWSLRRDPYTSMDAPREHAEPYRESRQILRNALHRESPSAITLLLHEQYGYARGWSRISWRDVCDYGILHPLLTQDERTFNSEVWCDFIQHRGAEWSKPEHATIWAEWQDAAYASFVVLQQARLELVPLAAKKHAENNYATQSPTPVDWSKVFDAWGRHYPLLNQNSDVEQFASTVLSSEAYTQYLQREATRPGKPLFELLGDLPFETGSRPWAYGAWMHAWVANVVNTKPAAHLPVPHDFMPAV